MGQLSKRVKEEIVLGLKSGGRVPIPIIDEHIRYALRQLYNQSSMVKAELPAISETIGETEYEIIQPTVGEYTKILTLNRVTRDGSGAITARALISPDMYAVGIVQPVDGSDSYEGIAIAQASPATVADSLVPYGAMTYDTEDQISSIHIDEATDAVIALVSGRLVSEVGKPWSNPNAISLFISNYDRALGIIRGRVIRGGTTRTLTMKTTSSFV